MMSFPVGDVRNFFTLASVPNAGSPSGDAMPVDAPTTVYSMQSPGARGGGNTARRPVRGARGGESRDGGRDGEVKQARCVERAGKRAVGQQRDAPLRRVGRRRVDNGRSVGRAARVGREPDRVVG